MSRISFDFDGTLSLKRNQDTAKQLMKEGNEIYIISARSEISFDMYRVADYIGVPYRNVYAVGSNKAKIEKIKELNIKTHYDNSDGVINELRTLNIPNFKAIKVI